MIFLHLAFTLWFAAWYGNALLRSAARPAAPHDSGPLFTFVVDPLTFFVVGILATLLSRVHRKGRALTQREFRSREAWLRRLLMLFVLGFWSVEILTYLDLLDMHRGLYPDRSGNWFMWNGYLDMLGFSEIVDTSVPTYRDSRMNLLAFGLLLAQLPFLLYGRVLGRVLGWVLDWNNWSSPAKS